MRNTLSILALLLVGCNTEPDVSVQPKQLVGTWNSRSTLTSADKLPYVRWTFDSTSVYIKSDSLKLCQPINSYNTGNYYKYWIEGHRLIMRYAGFTTGLVPIPDINRQILSITETEIVLDTPLEVLKKCQ